MFNPRPVKDPRGVKYHDKVNFGLIYSLPHFSLSFLLLPIPSHLLLLSPTPFPLSPSLSPIPLPLSPSLSDPSPFLSPAAPHPFPLLMGLLRTDGFVLNLKLLSQRVEATGCICESFINCWGLFQVKAL